MDVYPKIIVLGLLFVTATCSREDAVLLEVEGLKYTVADFKERMTMSPTDDSLQRAARFNEYIDIMLVVKAGADRGYETDSVIRFSLENHKREVVARHYYQDKVAKQVKVSDVEIRRQYEKMIDQYHLAQIVVESESLARFLEQQLARGTAFESLLVFSLDTITTDGDIGEFNALMLPEEILKPLRRIGEGKTTKAVKFGDYHYVFKLVERRTLDSPTFEEVKENIRVQLLNEKMSRKAEELVDRILEKTKIEFSDEGLAALLKPDSLITPDDMNKWVVKRDDTSYVYVHAIRDAVLFQYRRSGADPRYLIERVLLPDLIYEKAIREFYDKKIKVKRQLRNALASLIYQKVYKEEVLDKASVDSLEVVLHYNDNREKYADKKLEDCFLIVRAEIREQKVRFLREALFARMRAQYAFSVNESAYNSLIKEAR